MNITRHIWLIPFLLVQPLTLFADGAKGESPSAPPAYKNLRFDENYSYLADPAKRSDWLDPIKYIPLQKNEPNLYLSLGGELRERFEGVRNPDFGISGDHDAYWLQRIILFGDLHLGKHLRFFVEGISGTIEGESRRASPTQDDPINLQFAFADFTPYITDDEHFTLRVGRFGISLGSGRLVATRAAPNIPFKFDGFELLYERPLWQTTAFITRPVKEFRNKFDSEDHSIAFWGLYVTHWFDARQKSGLDLYYLGIQRDHGSYASGTGKELRHSLGARLFGEKNQWDWNGEGVVQNGSFGGQTILAWTASLDSGYTWETKCRPRLGLKADIASGDTNSKDGQQGTFDALYFKSGYFNDASLVRPANIMDLHPNLSANLTRAISLNGGVDIFWRYSRNDAVYAPSGFIQLPAQKSGSSYVGTAFDLNVEWQIQRHVSLLASYVHFLGGSYVHSAGGRDVDYLSTTISFLF